MRAAPIRVRLAAWYAAVLLAGLVLFGFGMWFALERRLTAGVDTRLEERVAGLGKVLDLEGGFKDPPQLKIELAEFAQEVPDGNLITLLDPDGRRLLPASGAPVFEANAAGGTAQFGTETRTGRPYRVLRTSFRHGGARLAAAVAAPLAETEAVLRDFRELLLGLIPAVLLAACLGGYWISGRALKPVDEITRAARTITVRNLSQRLRVPASGDELARLSTAWNETLERLEGAVERIQQFTADASHELRSPLARIRTTAELALRREREPEEYRRALAEIERESERMAELAEALLELARADAGGAAMPLAEVDLNEIVRGVAGECRAAAEAQRVTVETQLAPGPATAPAHAAGLRRLLLILAGNAFEHTPRGGRVTLTVKAEEGGVVLAVEDTGEGIPKDALPHVFERFFRADTARSSGSGVGLGLSIAQRIAQAHGSEIRVESEAGQGTRFWLRLRA